jgi:hypothetical protein
MEVRYDLPDLRRRMLAAERRFGDQIFAHCQSADDNRVETTKKFPFALVLRGPVLKLS